MVENRGNIVIFCCIHRPFFFFFGLVKFGNLYIKNVNGKSYGSFVIALACSIFNDLLAFFFYRPQTE